MQPVELVTVRCKCRFVAPAVFRTDDPRLGSLARCPGCRRPYTPDPGGAFGALQWDACPDPIRMRDALRLLAVPVPPRKLRLGACFVCRTEFDWCRNPRFLEAVAVGEAFADGEVTDRERQKAYDYLRDVAVWDAGWRDAGLWCVTPDQPTARGHDLRSLVPPADWYREAFGNPFDPVRFTPEWRTSTAVGLARVMVGRRTFHLFPYLSDALQDAGCDDPRVRAHCESNRPHGRGCWLLDAVLGVA